MSKEVTEIFVFLSYSTWLVIKPNVYFTFLLRLPAWAVMWLTRLRTIDRRSRGHPVLEEGRSLVGGKTTAVKRKCSHWLEIFGHISISTSRKCVCYHVCDIIFQSIEKKNKIQNQVSFLILTVISSNNEDKWLARHRNSKKREITTGMVSKLLITHLCNQGHEERSRWSVDEVLSVTDQ